MKTIRIILSLFLLALATAIHAESISVSPVTLEPGGLVPIPVNCEFNSEDITLYQFDLYLPNGVTLAKNNKGRYAAGTTYTLSDRHDEHTASLKDNTGFVRFVVSQNDGYLITPGEGLLLTLYVQADASVSGELQASIKNFMMFETDETKHAMSDVTFKMTVPAANIPVTGITLNKTTASLTSRGQTLQLTATVTPDNATDKSVTWTSSNTAVATVSSTGLVTAVANGTATITAKTADGSNKTATCTVTVNIPVPATGISLNKTTATLTSSGQMLQLSATVTPSNATNKSVTWTSSNTAVATVSSTGLVTAVSNGSATITAKASDGSNKTATCAVTVNISVPVTGITLNQTTASLTSRGQTLQLTATVTPDNATNKSVTWSSSNPSVATVDANGLVTAVSSGTATITAKAATTSDGSSKTATCAVTVNISVPASESISVSPVTLESGGIVPIPVNCSFSCEDITLYQFDLYLPEGVTLAKNNKGRYAVGTTYVLSDRHDEHTASLKDNTGFVRFVVSQNDGYLITPGEGLLLTLYVQADASVSGELQASIKNFMMFETDETKHAMSDVTFKMMVPSANIPVTGITLNKTTASLTSRGQTLQLTATVTPENATDKSVTWSSSNTSVATVDANGLVTAVSSGTATITAKTADGSNKTATCAVTVNISVPVTGITLNQTTATLTSRGQTLQLTATVTPENATDKSVMWSSSNPSVATVSSTGLVTAVSSGTATITAKAADGSNKTATCAVTVNISVPVTGITLNQTTATLTSRGQTLQLTATVTPENATDKSVMWSSSNPSVATVSSTGLVTAVSSGTATITAKTATTSDGSSKTATCAVTVNISVPASESISVSPVTLESGGIVPIPVNCSFSCEDITLYQFDLYLPEGVTLAKNNKDRYAVGTTYVLSDRHDEHTASLKDNTGFVRFVVSQNDGYLITPGEGLLLTLYVQADASVSGELQASIKNFMMFETDETKHAMSDVTFKMMVPAINQNIQFADAAVKAICVANWDTDGDGELSEDEAAQVKDIGTVFKSNKSIKYFNELQYFTELTSIGQDAFDRCSALTSVTIPNSVTSIGEGAFANCRGLTSLKVEDGNPKYDSRDNCNAIIESATNTLIAGCKTTTIPNSVTSIGGEAFSGCSLTSVTIPNSVTSIGQYAFSGCSGLTKAEFASIESLCKIKFGNYYSNPLYYAHYLYINGQEVTDVVIPNSVTSIKSYAFCDCSGLTSVTIPNSVTSIGSDAFSWCMGLTSVTIPNSVTSIGYYAFYNCSSLTSVTIPNSVTSIGGEAFSGCSGLTSLKVEEGNPKYDSRNNCNAIIETSTNTLITGCQNTTIPYSITCIGGSAFSGCSGLTSITIPNSVTSIGDWAFSGCSSLTSVTIPNSVTSIGEGTFAYCRGLTSVTIPNSVTSIGNHAFDDCRSLTSVTIPNSVTSIGQDAFSGCRSLTKAEFASIEGLCKIKFGISLSNPLYYAKHLYINGQEVTDVVIPNSVTSIGDRAFYGCSGLTSVTIPNSVTSIGYRAFYYCRSLSEVWCMAKRVPETASDAFSGSNISSATLYVPISSVENYKSTAPWMEFGSFSTIYDIEADDIYYNINEDGTSVSVTHGINENNTYSGSVVIPAVITDDGKEYNVTGIGESAFSNCTDLISVTLPNGVTSISNDAIPSTTKIYVDKGVYPLIAVWNYGRNPYDLSTNTCLTPPFNTRINSNASSIGLIANVSDNLIKTENESLTINGVTKKGQKARFNGLTPNTYYQVQYDASVIYGDGSATFSSNGNISTKSLTLTLSPPKVFSLGNAIVEATSNLDDDEENVGFEWRRMDWSDEMMSNRGVAYLYEGIMEGNIRNLNTEQYWKVRPYYMANDGTYYYGEWGGFDPANTSYFEPTVHTYSKIDQTDNKVQISGYVQRATDAVSKQGFKYWIQEDEGYARGAGVSIPTGARTVEAEGRVMEVELTGLMPNTTYAYVAFVTTVEGETFYGKQQSFTTGDDPAAAIVGDANGNGEVEIGDVTSVLTLMATPEATGYDNKAADANGNGEIEIGDVTTILTIMAGGE